MAAMDSFDPNSPPRDTLFAQPVEALGAFQFDQSVAAVFPDMIRRSVPGYQTILTGIGELTARYWQPGSRLYDLGCSLGAAALTMRRQLPREADCRIVAVDNSEAMLSRAREYVDAYRSEIPIDLVCADVCDIPIEDASVVVMNFTLQFIDPTQRTALLQRIFDGLRPNGILILSEKIHFEDPAIQAAIEHLHLQFKRANGYSELEISQKRSALENVLITDTLATHLERLHGVGFAHAAPWFQAYNFTSLLCIK